MPSIGNGGKQPARVAMYFLLRLTFWFAVVLFLLPFGTQSTHEPEAAVGPLEAVSAARGAIEDVAGMCERQPEVCVTGKAAMRLLGTRARDTAKGVYEQLDQTLEEPGAERTGAIPLPTPRPQVPVE